MTKAVNAATGGDEATALAVIQDVFIGKVDDEKEEIADGIRDKINREIRKYELDGKTERDENVSLIIKHATHPDSARNKESTKLRL